MSDPELTTQELEDLDELASELLALADAVEKRLAIMYRRPDRYVDEAMMAHAHCLCAGKLVALICRGDDESMVGLVQAMVESLVQPLGLEANVKDACQPEIIMPDRLH